MIRRLKTDIIQHIRNNLTLYLIILFALMAGITAGAFTAGAIEDVQRTALSGYLQDFFSGIKQEGVDRNAVFLKSVGQHFQSTFLIWLSGLFRFGMPFVFLFVGARSFFIGFTAGFLISQYHFGGFLFSLVCIFPQTLLYILSLTGIGVLAMEHSVESFKNRKVKSSREQKRRNIGRYTVRILILFALLVAGSLAEAYISPVFFGLFRWVFD